MKWLRAMLAVMLMFGAAGVMTGCNSGGDDAPTEDAGAATDETAE